MAMSLLGGERAAADCSLVQLVFSISDWTRAERVPTTCSSIHGMVSQEPSKQGLQMERQQELSIIRRAYDWQAHASRSR
jgi:hypothetical protein